MRLKSRCLLTLLLLPLVALSSACSIPYYLQALHGQLDVLARRQPLETMLQDASLSPELQSRLRTVQALREFAERELRLPSSGSFRYYADLHRPYVVWNVYAAPEFSTDLHEWCYPVAGCASYRGYFSEAAAIDEAVALRNRGFDTHVAGVPAYSTLGWFDDPVFAAVLDWPDEQLAGLVFHELAHQQLYLRGDTVFNESFAVAVEQTGVRRWLAHSADADALEAYARRLQGQARRQARQAQARDALRALYQRDLPTPTLRAQKADILQRLAQDLAPLSAGPEAGSPASLVLNNAVLGAMAAYQDYVRAFHQLLWLAGDDFPLFYRYVAELAALPEARRSQCLVSLDVLNLRDMTASQLARCPAHWLSAAPGAGSVALSPG